MDLAPSVGLESDQLLRLPRIRLAQKLRRYKQRIESVNKERNFQFGFRAFRNLTYADNLLDFCSQSWYGLLLREVKK